MAREPDREGLSCVLCRLIPETIGSKPTKDKELAEWQHIAGTAYRMVLPDKEAGVDPDAAPFEIYTLDPRFSFVVRYNDLGLPTVMGVKYVERGNGDRVFGCYTADHYYEIDSSWKILKSEEQIFGIPNLRLYLDKKCASI